MTHAIHRHAGWLACQNDHIFYWLHQPTAEACHRLVILSPPIGYEYVHSHRTLKHLADQLAETGCCVARLDYPGTGNASSDLTSNHLVQRWIAAIGAVRDELVQHCPDLPVTLVGLRLGATFAVQALRPSDGIVLVEPVVSGKRMVRELTATAGFAEVQSNSGFIESGGFIYSDETLASLSDLAITSDALQIAKSVSCFSEKPNKALLTCLEPVGVGCNSYQGYADMMAEPQYTRVPADLLQQIVALLKNPLHETGKSSAPTSAPVPVSIATSQMMTDDYTESCFVDDLEQFAVLTEPAHELPGASMLVLINSGSVHHVGPNRTYSEFCRTAAAQGIPSIRFDLANLGDSARAESPEENNCYPDEAKAYTLSMLQEIKRRFPNKTISLGGICSGAHHAIHGALADPALVQRLIVINPLTFYWVPGMSLAIPDGDASTHKDTAYYSQALRDPRSWLKLLKGQASVGYIIGYCLRYARKRIAALADQLAGLIKPVPDTRMNRDLRTLVQAGVDIHFVFSDRDPGWNILADETRLPKAKIAKRLNVKIHPVTEANHTFSWYVSRAKAATLIAQLLVAAK